VDHPELTRDGGRLGSERPDDLGDVGVDDALGPRRPEGLLGPALGRERQSASAMCSASQPSVGAMIWAPSAP
jgi:hypothetical protein